MPQIESGMHNYRITREEFERLRKDGYAGFTSDLLPETRAHWDTPYWSLQLTAHGPALVATEIVDEE